MVEAISKPWQTSGGTDVERQDDRKHSLPNSNSTTKEAVDIPENVDLALQSKGLHADRFGIVRWRKDTKIHPRRWPLRRKIYDSSVIILMEFIMTLFSNVGSSVVPYSTDQLHLSHEIGLLCFTTTYLLGQALGGIIFSPLAESFGGYTFYVTCAVGFSACGVLVGACPTVPAVVGGRFVSGFLSAMPAVVAGGSLENMWDTKARIWIIHLWCCSAVAALALAPIFAVGVSESALGWPWLFYLAAISSGVLVVACILMRESRPSKVLRKQVRAVSNDTEFDQLSLGGDAGKPTFQEYVQTSITLPVRLFLTEPIVFFTSIMGATMFAAIYLFTAALPEVYTDYFGFSATQSSLIFMPIAVGVLFTILPRIYDVKVSCRKEDIEPEDKLFGFYVAAPVIAVGFWWFAFAVPPLNKTASPWASIISLTLFGYSVVEFENILSGYLCDSYASRTASALAPMSFLRATLSGTFPLFAATMFHELGGTYAMFILAGVATSFCGVAIVFRMYGKRIRERSPFADELARS